MEQWPIQPFKAMQCITKPIEDGTWLSPTFWSPGGNSKADRDSIDTDLECEECIAAIVLVHHRKNPHAVLVSLEEKASDAHEGNRPSAYGLPTWRLTSEESEQCGLAGRILTEGEKLTTQHALEAMKSILSAKLESWAAPSEGSLESPTEAFTKRIQGIFHVLGDENAQAVKTTPKNEKFIVGDYLGTFWKATSWSSIVASWPSPIRRPRAAIHLFMVSILESTVVGLPQDNALRCLSIEDAPALLDQAFPVALRTLPAILSRFRYRQITFSVEALVASAHYPRVIEVEDMIDSVDSETEED